MNNKQPVRRRVLVLGHDIRAFLSVIRSLGRAGIEVHVAMCPSNDLALRSKYVTQRHELPHFDRERDAWLASVCRLADDIGFDLIIPTNDESTMLIQEFQHELAKHCQPYAINAEAYDIAFDKIKSSKLAESLGLMIPRQQELDLSTYESGQSPEIAFPLVAKPPSSLADDKLSSRREVKHIKNQTELDAFATRNRHWSQTLLQEYFYGAGAGVEVLALGGTILYAFQHMRVHEPLDGGASSYRRSMELNPILLNATRKLMRAMNYSGVAMVEYKLNTETGQWIFIEINGRFWGSLPLAISAGANFPLFLYQQRVDGKTDFETAYNPRIYSRNLLRDLYWIADNTAARRLPSPPRASIPLSRVFMEVGNIVSGRDRIDSFALDDLKPGFGELGIILGEITEKIGTVLTTLLRSIPWYRQRQANRIRKRFEKAKTVEFVCYGNICRSAFAAPYMAQRTDSKVVRSSGVHPETDRMSPDLAIEAAKDFDVDLAPHRSELLDQQRVESADLLLIFDEKNKQALARLYPNASRKIEFLGFLLPEGNIEISDPYSHDLKTFRHTYAQISHAVDRLTDR